MRVSQRSLRKIFILIAMPTSLAVSLGCSPQNKVPPRKAANNSPAIVLAQTNQPADISPGEAPLAVQSADEAKRLAELHVALRKKSWGAAKNISDQQSSYWVSFETPEHELRLLGPRVIVIDKQTGAANVQSRR